MKHPDLDDPDMALGTLMTLWPQTVRVFMRHQMLCVGCAVNGLHTVIDACLEYGLDEQRFRNELHEAARI